MANCRKCGQEFPNERRAALCRDCNREYQRQWRAMRRAAGKPLRNEVKREPRPIKIDGDVAFVPLTKGLQATIDADCAHLVSGWDWSAQSDRSGPYAKRSIYEDGKCKVLMMHRVILPVSQGMQVDHINGDRLDNRRANLREATHSENARNRGIGKNNKSGIKGVRWCPVLCKWMSWITVDGKRTYLGSFHDLEGAAKAYANASREMHGEFGRAARARHSTVGG